MTSLDQFWRSSGFSVWLTLAAAVFFAFIVFLTLIRAEKSVANGILTVITLLAIGVAAAVTLRFEWDGGRVPDSKNRDVPVNVAMPALSCIDGLAGEPVESACEKALFGMPDAAAAAVSYVASEISRLRSFGDAAAADSAMSPELEALRRAIERDRYGLVAHVLVVRDHCQPSDCPAFQSLTDHSRIAANMEEQLYEKLVMRYASSWSAPAAATQAAAPDTPTPALASESTGHPTTIDFPTAASIPPVNIMTPEPATGTAPAPSASTAAAVQAVPKPRPAAKKPPAPKPHVAPPVRLAPAPSAQN